MHAVASAACIVRKEQTSQFTCRIVTAAASHSPKVRLDLVARASRTRACSVGEPQSLAMKPDVVTQYPPSDNLEVGVGGGGGREGGGGKAGGGGGGGGGGPDQPHRNEKNKKVNNHFSINHLTPTPVIQFGPAVRR